MGSMFQYVSDEEGIVPVLKRVLARWDEVVRPCKRCKAYQIALHVSTQPLEVNVLASTLVTKFLYLGEHTFGNTFPMVGAIVLNSTYLYGSLKEDHLYAVLLHEVGHVLGIGTVWNLAKSPLTLYQEDNKDKYYYTGSAALREYKTYFPTSELIGIPLEDDGGDGTEGSHPEEHMNRKIDGTPHPGLQDELMTGWLGSLASLSRITLGFLEDIGYEVDYSKADPFDPSV